MGARAAVASERSLLYDGDATAHDLYDLQQPPVGIETQSIEEHLTTDMASIWRKAQRLALLPFVQGPEEVLVGGQAVIEGVMMRSPHSWAVAVRKMSGSMAVMQEHLDRPSERRPWL
ncbi:MAG: hypothetical protein ACRD2P_16895, partial [Terriglobia bacterium]